MRKMFSQKQIEEIAKNVAVEGIEGKDIAPKNISATGTITGNEIVENMSGYSATSPSSATGWTFEKVYFGCVKNGNKVTFVGALNVTKTDASANIYTQFLSFTIPSAVGSKLYPTTIGGQDFLDVKEIVALTSGGGGVSQFINCQKTSNTKIIFSFSNATSLVLNTKYFVRIETTFLLSENLAS